MTRIRCWTAADLEFAWRLKTDAGWNQTKADLARFLHLQPEGCFVAEHHGRAVGTAAAFLFCPVAWIALVLVEASMRGRGIGRELTGHALDWAISRGAASVRLDATPLGRPLYEKLGFLPQFQVLRFAGRPEPAAINVWEGVETTRPEHFEAMVKLDRMATATERSRLLRKLWEENPDTARVATHEGQVTGFLLARPGSHAAQIGPCVATSVETGRWLLGDASHRLAGQSVYLDLPADNRGAVETARSLGLRVQRELSRMCYGEQVVEDVSVYWASSGPEKG